MAEEAIIFPSAPLFMVDRGWQRHRKKGRKVSALERAEDPPSRVPEVTITVMKASAKTNGTRTKSPSANDVEKRGPRKNVELQFMSYDPQPAEKTQEGRNRRKALSGGKKSSVKQESTPLDHSSAEGSSIPSDDRLQLSPVLRKPVPGSTFPMYTVIDPEVSAFQSLLSYCEWSS